ncbi:2-oxo-4-hydroxy-4-carboxy-5-ureidoimidazoline decarboxylase [Rhodococcus sp. BGS-1C]|uniref:2-oxo-4-hydroxy-4-carboxy-5-ureidoimidazoline decarboxylase n=2 Tax=Mycobacteriales TaxID=85007 RepID=UPI00096A303E|nr:MULTISPECIES: 2-oxo-4-hydroxy-4-carboxy-5-ureidoimidazoline decarboxylase [Rhodococcus]MCC8928455.1 2-oxo-4-hydroxy-4-carboxy-5-ureidoimidazoline decarboxylase [Rhodococcus sp. I2R]MCZ4277141.1 2-oxo-4-hydroxy-4-carboxy-5-ureidoimidazoline decarboxylase [Rhodococcus yunnanensis]
MLHEWIGLEGFNRLSDRQAMHALFECCSSSIWARRVAGSRPFTTRDQLLDRAERVLAELPEAEIDRALDGHPRIGGTADNASSQREQAAVQRAGSDLLTELAAANRKYEDQFGHVYLVCATGRSAEELLAILEERLGNDPETERRVLRVELAKINRIRLNRLLGPEE